MEVEETQDEGLDLGEQAAQAALAEEAAAAEGNKGGDEGGGSEGGENTGVLDIDSQEKVMFNGKEYTPEQLNKMLMMQSDYTKKTQAIASEKKYYDNLQYDLDAVRENPEKAAQFKKLYPEKFHVYLDFLNTGAQDSTNRDKSGGSTDQRTEALLQKIDNLESKLSQYDQKFHDEKVDAENARLDAVFEKLSGEFDLADEDAVLNKAQALIDANKDNPEFRMTDSAWKRLFKADHEARDKRYSERHRKLLEKQAKQGDRGNDGGPGGAAPGRPRKRETMAEATERMIQDLSR